jgi:Putative zinc-finger
MDHTAVVREKMTERYLLNELESDVCDQFEEHYFDCPECAQDLCAGSQFIAQAKVVLAEPSETVSVRATPGQGRVPRWWFAWLRPAFAAPALALLLAVAGYQNLVTYPRLQAELHTPQILPAVSVNVGTYGAPETTVPQGKGFLLSLRIPPDAGFVRYRVDLHNPGGKPVGSFTVAPAAGQDQWSVAVAGVDREAGSYTMDIHGITTAGETKDLGSASFQLQIQR